MSFTVACYQKFHFRKHRVEFAVVDGVKNKYCLMLRTGPLETKCATFRLVNIHAATRNLTDCVDTVIVRPVTESAIRTNPQSPLEKGFRLIWAAKPPNNKAGNRIKTECGCRKDVIDLSTSRHRSKWTATPGIVKFNAKTLDRNVDDELVDALVRFESEVEKPEYLEEGWKKGGGRNRRVKGKGEWEEG
ncbi:hypothetical protein HZH66_009680 [Vespula vulgaris]|uniref:Uncharacterized protein n=1 Tax=Vespula vulgaris TaxID=7454 RepID=A0A834MZJ3_VESVU|nr:hypothetical protein HZH66_009680 [Vespula vulgaris]